MERERLGLSQGEMHAISGASRRAQFNYEQGVRLPDVGYLAALAQRGFDVLYLVTGTRVTRHGAVDENMLCRVLVAVDVALGNRPIDAQKKSKLIALVYQSASDSGQIDQLLVKKAIDLAF
ncbi:helix-turn-helix domain-containing protein [Paraburkholderia sp. BL23I1N1]|uniref:helix-turn-helix domain-containing protein n=1 Tax=Paraburkholderia sp. BL23I1N1 TaxID=1938802 RepID=UPI00217CC7DC|nr:helix-turn-helix transcriptional regulator [Paraburkholderia sp. BL23I1N1]